jgi:hypothetical protein
LTERKTTRKESVAARIGGNFGIFARRSTWLSILLSGAFWWSATGAEAGIILASPGDESPTRVEVNLDSASSSGAPQKSDSDHEAARQSDQKNCVFRILDGLVETGGASAPGSAPIGHSGITPVAILDVPTMAPAASSLALLREHLLKVPQPPPGELLDPPKDR